MISVLQSSVEIDLGDTQIYIQFPEGPVLKIVNCFDNKEYREFINPQELEKLRQGFHEFKTVQVYATNLSYMGCEKVQDSHLMFRTETTTGIYRTHLVMHFDKKQCKEIAEGFLQAQVQMAR